jgi:uncharacterized damage-inducible protein DinB
MTESRPEAWLRGPVGDVPAPLQPVAHALLQAADEVAALLQGVSSDVLWARPHGVASAGFHVQHMRGVLDRLFTYARGEQLTPGQMAELAAEGTRPASAASAADLTKAFREQVELALAQLSGTDEETLGDPRAVGRRQLPSTVQGLLFHAAEHVQRHVGQLLVTVRVQQSASPGFNG